jgi:ankyrin repeat protein
VPLLNPTNEPSQIPDFGMASGTSSPMMKGKDNTQYQFEWACRNNDVKQAKICYLRGASLTDALSSGEFPLFYAVRKQHWMFVEFLHEYDVDINKRDKAGRTALHIAALKNDAEGICRLVQLGANCKLRDYKGRTALHRAAAAGRTRVVELLLEMGADINDTDKSGRTAASHAEFNDHFELADRLTKIAQPISGMHAGGPTYLFLRSPAEDEPVSPPVSIV